MHRLNRRGILTFEYVLVYTLIAVMAVVTAYYVRTSVSGKLRMLTEYIGPQYHPGATISTGAGLKERTVNRTETVFEATPENVVNIPITRRPGIDPLASEMFERRQAQAIIAENMQMNVVVVESDEVYREERHERTSGMAGGPR
jgi:Flp pilus assembly pilin Flp